MINFITKDEVVERLQARLERSGRNFSDKLSLHNNSKTNKPNWYAVGPVYEYETNGVQQCLTMSWFDIRLSSKHYQECERLVIEACMEVGLAYKHLGDQNVKHG